jgi:hypothetical protein
MTHHFAAFKPEMRTVSSSVERFFLGGWMLYFYSNGLVFIRIYQLTAMIAI